MVNFTLDQTMKGQKGSSGIALLFFNLDTRWGGWLTPCPSCFTLGNRPGTHCIEGWVGPRVHLDGCRKSCPYWDLIPRPSSPYLLTSPYKSPLNLHINMTLCSICSFTSKWHFIYSIKYITHCIYFMFLIMQSYISSCGLCSFTTEVLGCVSCKEMSSK